ncbi:hypothetical protein [Buchananella hordeovulneris]|uniref:hypothetical protein n=1 Tax=Buchananella hordeovulneris TaxID=52770 RepID=UPI0011612CEE|nr:hypothetical protein [Buchananella hordeovulneris]
MPHWLWILLVLVVLGVVGLLVWRGRRVEDTTAGHVPSGLLDSPQPEESAVPAAPAAPAVVEEEATESQLGDDFGDDLPPVPITGSIDTESVRERLATALTASEETDHSDHFAPGRRSSGRVGVHAAGRAADSEPEEEPEVTSLSELLDANVEYGSGYLGGESLEVRALAAREAFARRKAERAGLAAAREEAALRAAEQEGSSAAARLAERYQAAKQRAEEAAGKAREATQRMLHARSKLDGVPADAAQPTFETEDASDAPPAWVDSESAARLAERGKELAEKGRELAARSWGATRRISGKVGELATETVGMVRPRGRDGDDALRESAGAAKNSQQPASIDPPRTRREMKARGEGPFTPPIGVAVPEFSGLPLPVVPAVPLTPAQARAAEALLQASDNNLPATTRREMKARGEGPFTPPVGMPVTVLEQGAADAPSSAQLLPVRLTAGQLARAARAAWEAGDVEPPLRADGRNGGRKRALLVRHLRRQALTQELLTW